MLDFPVINITKNTIANITYVTLLIVIPPFCLIENVKCIIDN